MRFTALEMALIESVINSVVDSEDCACDSSGDDLSKACLLCKAQVVQEIIEMKRKQAE